MATIALAGTLGCTAVSGAPPQAADPADLPSLELLDYLADFEEDAQGHLLDPLAQADREGRERRDDDSDRDYWQRQSDR